MSDTILISDGEDQATPPPFLSKRARTNPIPTILISDTDPTPQKRPPDSASTPSFVAETPFSDDVSVVKCSIDVRAGVSGSDREDKFSGKRIISLESESENESENSCGPEISEKNESTDFSEPHHDNNIIQMYGPSSAYLPDTVIQVDAEQDTENISIDPMRLQKQIRKPENLTHVGEALCKKAVSKEEKIRAMEEKKLKKEQEKLQKAALKAEEAERKKLEKEKQKWEKGKLALKSIVAEIDAKMVELGSVGGHLLSRFSEKGITFRITSNPIERSIVWTMTVPEHISQLLPQGPKIQYVLLVYEAEEFCNLVANERLLEHVSRVRSQYPAYTVCYLTNKLMAYINKREKEEYKKPDICSGWRRPPIEEVLAKLTTHYVRVHSRHCVDEAEVAEHVVGLTSSLASCHFRTKLTRLSVYANGALIPKDSVDKHLIKKTPWLKALIAIPKVQPRFALAVWKKYPTMKSLLKVYMDPTKSVHEKEFLLKDLKVEGLVGGDRRLGEVCSKRIFRVLMSQSGTIKTDDVENGADFFPSPSFSH
ncbi:PREDICTED: crossover junction endonuclease EME1B isoform X2 [Tarenaya hassleriana]|uniref:crossover junction endonuclease EME1B isoform X2 n=1 Tax=Tarenaya hassleriana TaxID=28532 RepID=UPI00053C5191|nr:PREDICTED: crossover junction endonuclease EME1B isoform X2 [Tarenaya hassleriana]